MKLSVLHVITLCTCFGQICLSKELSGDERIELENRIRGSFHGVGEQFMSDVKEILDKFRNDPMIIENLPRSLIKNARKTNATNSKIDRNVLEEYFATIPYFKYASALDIEMKMDNLKIFQSILSTKLPPERYNGILNYFYIFLFQNATTEEIDSALGYLYGTDTAATKVSFVNKFPDLSSAECSKEIRVYSLSEAEDTLKSMVGIRPKVIQDFAAIGDKFPCNTQALRCLQSFVYVMKRLNGDKSKIDSCMIKESPGNWENYWTAWHNTREFMEHKLQLLETILPTRLPDETFRGILNFKRATIPDTPIDEIEKALEYLYDDVPKIECPTAESTTLKTE